MHHRMLFVAVSLLVFATTSAYAEFIIGNDHGGRIDTYIDKYRAMYASGEQVVIDGTCASACTLALIIPPDRLCATARSKLGFHQAFDYGQAALGNKQVLIPNRRGSNFLMNAYPEPIQHWIRAHKGLPPPNKILWLRGRALARLVPTCNGTLPPIH